MQLICDGVKQKAEVLDVTLDEYRDVFVTARREFNTVIQVGDFLHCRQGSADEG
jgi:DNA topoisomerase-3